MSKPNNKYDGLDQIKYIRAQVGDCVIVEFINGSRACSCTLERGVTPNLRNRLKDDDE